MNDDDKRFAAWLAGCCIVGIVLVILAAVFMRPARAAALLNLDGKQIVVMTGDELVGMMKPRDDEIAALKAQLEAKHKAECNLI